MKKGMRIADPADLLAGARALRDTAAAVVGYTGDVFSAPGETFEASLTVDPTATVPSVVAFRPGVTHRALVQAGPDDRGQTARKLCIKLCDVYGDGRHQDFLLASSGDGAPLHHAVLPSDPVAPLYSSLWLYLAGLQPILFGARPNTTGRTLRFAAGSELSFMISPPVGQFRRVGTLRLTAVHDGPVRFAGSTSGGGLRPLPPVLFY